MIINKRKYQDKPLKINIINQELFMILLTVNFLLQCDRCECEPIVGIRWHCTDCPPDIAVDFCDECVDWYVLYT